MQKALHILRPFALVSALAVLATAGCGGPRPSVPIGTVCYPVKGKVIGSDGQPLKAGTVSLVSTDITFTSTGTIQADGTFSITSKFINPDKESSGAPAASYMAYVRVDDSGLPAKLKRKSVSVEPKENNLILEVESAQ